MIISRRSDRGAYLRDIHLAESLRYQKVPAQRATQGKSIFLTGVTGFLGTHLLADILRFTNANVMCMVRAESISEAYRRIKFALQENRLSANGLTDRVVPVQGDLALPYFGMSEQRFRELGGKCSAIYHAAAALNLAHTYPSLRATNVCGTLEILRLASIGPASPVHLISSLSVFNGIAYREMPIVPESWKIENGEGLDRGYSQSKWVAERLVNAAVGRGLTASIYRPGIIAGNSDTGVCNPNDRFSLLLRSCVLLGVAPEFHGVLQLTPVDEVSYAISAISRLRNINKRAFHIISPQSLLWMDVVKTMQDVGYPVRTMQYSQWLRLLRKKALENPEWQLQPLPIILFGRRPFQRNLQRKFERFSTTNALDNYGEPPPSCATLKLIEKQLSYLSVSGYL